jgi:hypothetical protein
MKTANIQWRERERERERERNIGNVNNFCRDVLCSRIRYTHIAADSTNEAKARWKNG